MVVRNNYVHNILNGEFCKIVHVSDKCERVNVPLKIKNGSINVELIFRYNVIELSDQVGEITKKECKIITRTSGCINDYKTINLALKKYKLDFLALGRVLIKDKYFLLKKSCKKQKDKIYDREVVRWWHQALQNTTILSSDFAPVVLEHAANNSFVFMDPPYRDSFTQYETDFNDQHQERVISCLSHCQDAGALGWMSNRDAHDGFFEERWPKEKIKYFDVTYTAGRRKKTDDGFKAKSAQEVLLTTK